MLELAGIHDILSKSLGTQNPINLVKATMAGLESLRTPAEVADVIFREGLVAVGADAGALALIHGDATAPGAELEIVRAVGGALRLARGGGAGVWPGAVVTLSLPAVPPAAAGGEPSPAALLPRTSEVA